MTIESGNVSGMRSCKNCSDETHAAGLTNCMVPIYDLNDSNCVGNLKSNNVTYFYVEINIWFMCLRCL
jgi:hypothetical protein